MAKFQKHAHGIWMRFGAAGQRKELNKTANLHSVKEQIIWQQKQTDNGAVAMLRVPEGPSDYAVGAPEWDYLDSPGYHVGEVPRGLPDPNGGAS